MTELLAKLAGARALRFEREPPAAIDAIVIVGSTCAGKTTLARAIRSAELPGVDIPRRFVTRPPRADDVAAEAHYVTDAKLETGIAAGEIAIHWSRALEPERTERYAFARPAPGMLAVYSANNAIYLPGNAHPADALSRALMVGVFAPDAVREQRLRARSPELWRDHPDEALARLADRAANILPHVDVVIENHGELEPIAMYDIVALVRAVAG